MLGEILPLWAAFLLIVLIRNLLLLIQNTKNNSKGYCIITRKEIMLEFVCWTFASSAAWKQGCMFSYHGYHEGVAWPGPCKQPILLLWMFNQLLTENTFNSHWSPFVCMLPNFHSPVLMLLSAIWHCYYKLVYLFIAHFIHKVCSKGQ